MRPRDLRIGGVAGVAAVAAYLSAAFVSWPDTQAGISSALLVASLFPILGIVFAHGLWSFIAVDRDGASNRLGFAFAVAAFSTVLDVAWDFLIGTALVMWGTAMSGRAGLGRGWGVSSAVLGALLVILNAATFPWPPADRGLFDVGPFIGVFMMALAARVALLARRAVPLGAPPGERPRGAAATMPI